VFCDQAQGYATRVDLEAGHRMMSDLCKGAGKGCALYLVRDKQGGKSRRGGRSGELHRGVIDVRPKLHPPEECLLHLGERLGRGDIQFIDMQRPLFGAREDWGADMGLP
jgi:hypothetical protein